MNRNTVLAGTTDERGQRPRFRAASVVLPVLAFTIPLALALILLFPTPLSAMPSSQQTPPLAADARLGLPIYTEKCAPCHGDAGMGNGPNAAQLQYPPTQFADAATMWEKAPADLFAVIKNGRIERFMPPFSQSLSDQDIWNVLAFVWFLHHDQAEWQQGETVYQASCASCHGAAGKGDGPAATGPISDLTDLTTTAAQSQRAWFQALQTPAHSSIASLAEDDRWAALEFVRAWTLPPITARPYTPGAGLISGVVSNDTPQGDPTGALTVTLSIFDDFNLITEISTTTSVTGLYQFDKLDTDPSWMYVANLSFKDVPYSTGVITLTQQQPAKSGPISVYEPTTDTGVVAVERAHWFLEFDQTNLLVAELYIWSNNSDRVYVGAPSSATTSTVSSILPFDLPSGFQSLTFDDGDIGGRYRRTEAGVVDTLPLPPGQGVRQTLLRYVMPFSSLTLDINHPVAFPLRSLNVLVADVGAKVSSPDLLEGPARQVDQATYFNFTASDVPAGKTIELKLTNLPLNGSPQTAVAVQANSPWLAVGVAGLAALGLLGVLFYAVRQRRSVVAADDGDEEGEEVAARTVVTPDSLLRRREGLILAIAQMDDQYAAGKINEADYQTRRARLKADLLAVAQALAVDQDTVRANKA